MATGRCAAALCLAFLFSLAGLGLLLGGGLGGAPIQDLLLYLGGLGLLFGGAWVVVWHVGNLEVPPALLRDDVGLAEGARPPQHRLGLARLLRSLGRRLSAPSSPSTLVLDAQEPDRKY